MAMNISHGMTGILILLTLPTISRSHGQKWRFEGNGHQTLNDGKPYD